MPTGFIPNDKSLNLESLLFISEVRYGRYNGYGSLIMGVMIKGRVLIQAGMRDNSDKSAHIPATIGLLVNALKSDRLNIGIGFSSNTINTTFTNYDADAAVTSFYGVGTIRIFNTLFCSVLGGLAFSPDAPLGGSLGFGLRFDSVDHLSFIAELYVVGTQNTGTAWVFTGGRYCVDAFIFELGYGILSDNPGLLLNVGVSM